MSGDPKEHGRTTQRQHLEKGLFPRRRGEGRKVEAALRHRGRGCPDPAGVGRPRAQEGGGAAAVTRRAAGRDRRGAGGQTGRKVGAMGPRCASRGSGHCWNPRPGLESLGAPTRGPSAPARTE